jgi:hypothetical protein
MTAEELIEEIARIVGDTPAHDDDTGAATCEANAALDQIDDLIDRWRLLYRKPAA